MYSPEARTSLGACWPTPFAHAQIDGIFVTDDAMSATVSPKLGIDRNKYDVKSIFTEYI